MFHRGPEGELQALWCPRRSREKVSTCDGPSTSFAGDWYAKVYVSEEVENDIQLSFCMFHRGASDIQEVVQVMHEEMDRVPQPRCVRSTSVAELAVVCQPGIRKLFVGVDNNRLVAQQLESRCGAEDDVAPSTLPATSRDRALDGVHSTAYVLSVDNR